MPAGDGGATYTRGRPASESHQGKNPRGMGRGEWRALRYGDLAGAEGVSAGAPCPSRRLVTRLAGSHSSG
jgi:hypothetical protein